MTRHITSRADVVKALPELSMTVYASNTTALNTAATQGHMEVVRLLLQGCRWTAAWR
jgi:hypothetical protein